MGWWKKKKVDDTPASIQQSASRIVEALLCSSEGWSASCSNPEYPSIMGRSLSHSKLKINLSKRYIHERWTLDLAGASVLLEPAADQAAWRCYKSLMDQRVNDSVDAWVTKLAEEQFK
jgi:hypothetical protein